MPLVGTSGVMRARHKSIILPEVQSRVPDDTVSLVQSALENHTETWYFRPHSTVGHPRLWVSEMFSCPRKVALRMRGHKKTVEPDILGKSRMRGGCVWEDDTANALKRLYGENFTDQLPLRTEMWSGKVDFALWHPMPCVLIEHKATGDKWWNYNNGMPRLEHVGQIWLYGRLYREIYQRDPKRLLLFYRSWSHYAEIDIIERHGLVVADGVMDGNQFGKVIGTVESFEKEKAGLEEVFKDRSSAVLPEKLTVKDKGCTFRGRPDCAYYRICWPQ